ncbi:MAG: primosomal protein N' [Moraxella sp.]|nr:primosomal protein N' [Moraxella sp.]
MSAYHAAILQLALPVPIGDVFDYLCPITTTLPNIGAQVQAPFGRRQLIGLVVGITKQSDIANDKLKPITTIISDTPILPEFWLNFARWLSGYYHYPLGETIAVMLPTLLKQGKQPVTYHRHLMLAHHDGTSSTLPKNATTLRHALDVITTLAKETPVCLDTVLAYGISKAILDKLVQKQLISFCDIPPKPPAPATQKDTPPTLNSEQLWAVKAINSAITDKRYQGFLLNGITGSGKTEVYLQAMAHALANGKQVLILLPEIGLTPQTKARFDERFCARILVLHSHLNDSERLAGWQACKDGQAQIIIATRSALFYPFLNLGLIVIDEAHDSSYKQQDHLRYHACDVALYLGFKLSIPVVLGSATPSLEQLHLVNTGKLHALTLTQRAGAALAPRYHLIDKRLGNHPYITLDGTPADSSFGARTVHEIRTRLAYGEQVLIFLNRRGYAPILLCQACGWQADCPRCSSHLTLHKSPLSTQKSSLICHHCTWQMPVPVICPACHSTNLSSLGQGTSQLFEQLHALFANPQTNQQTYPILQIDRDTTRKKGDWQRIYDTINTGAPMILVGTQMLSKGHHFADVTLVVIVDADVGFLSPNFRSPEHTAQQIVQVAGRAGRGNKAGDVFIQTLQPDNRLLVQLVKEGYLALANTLLAERQKLGLPPYSHAALISAQHKDYLRAKNAIIAAKNTLPSPHPFAVLAPIDAPLLKKNHQHHVQMLILAKHRPPLHQLLSWWWAHLQTLPEIKGVRLSLDIDPMGW